jgi:carboxylate-amine ligase
MATVRKVGVEEELLLVDPETGELAEAAGRVLHAHRTDRGDAPPDAASEDLEGELLRHMLETHTDPATDLAEVADQLREARRTAWQAAEDAGCVLAAVSVPPLGRAEPAVSANPRYERIVNEFGDVGRRAGSFGMHVHVDIADEDEGVRVLDHLRPWLPLLLALSANSPYWQGHDTGYASWRHQIWGQWPSSGTAEPFGSAAEYHRVTESLVRLGAALDAGMIYFDARLSRNFPTVEVRIADICTDLEDALVVVALVRALVETGSGARPEAEPVRTDVLRAAFWRAARYGLSGDLAHPGTWNPVPALDALAALVEHVSPALEAAGDRTLVEDGLARIAAAGNGARRQRAAYERTGDVRGVVADLVERTRESVS